MPGPREETAIKVERAQFPMLLDLNRAEPTFMRAQKLCPIYLGIHTYTLFLKCSKYSYLASYLCMHAAVHAAHCVMLYIIYISTFTIYKFTCTDGD